MRKKQEYFFTFYSQDTTQSHYWRAHSEFNFNGTSGGAPVHHKGVRALCPVVLQALSKFLSFILMQWVFPCWVNHILVYTWLCNSAPPFVAFQDGILSLFSASLNVSLASHFILESYLLSSFLKVLFWSPQLFQPPFCVMPGIGRARSSEGIQICIIPVKIMEFICFFATSGCDWQVLQEQNEVLLHPGLCMSEWLRACGGGNSAWAQITFYFFIVFVVFSV